jgi:hypothetical protein
MGGGGAKWGRPAPAGAPPLGPPPPGQLHEVI